ncbi:MAG TPA: Crp/Fnr family transcriptional regulator [Edaphocola sp.]|nr:Crp/Fnr family transcriptional regulator [Edaphocola sp.]
METFRFTTFLTSNLDINKDEIDLLLKNCTHKTVPAGTFLLRQGAYCRHTFFVENGLLRKYGVDAKGKEAVIQFAPEKWFVTDRDSSFFQQPSQFFIQAMEDSTVLMLDETIIEQLGQQIKGFVAFNQRLLHNHIRQQTKRIYELLSANAEERYLSFIATYPDLLWRVPQWMIASYLGITPESLSRIRKDMARKNAPSKGV